MIDAKEAFMRQLTLRIAKASTLRGQVVVIEGSRRHVLGKGTPNAMIEINDRRAWPMMWTRTGIVDAYLDEYWDSPDLAALFALAAQNLPRFDQLRGSLAPVRVPWLRLREAIDRRKFGAKRLREAAHYELGNALFALMLDAEMMYSCAFFPSPDATLDEAAVAKLEMICQKLNLSDKDHVVEIGSGWGGFAVHAARTRGCRVTTTTVSREQHTLATERVGRLGLQHLVDVRMDDYRDMTGTYDKLVSIEMIEAVGHRDLPGFFEKCASLVRPNGTMLLQAITIDDRVFDVSKYSRSFMQTDVFPGSCVPSQRAIAESVAKTDLRLVHLEDLTPHYVSTLQHWRRNLVAADVQLGDLGFDTHLRRLLQLYLAYSEAGFASGRTAVGQMLFAMPACRLALKDARWVRC